MATNKTVPAGSDVDEFLDGIADGWQRADARSDDVDPDTLEDVLCLSVAEARRS